MRNLILIALFFLTFCSLSGQMEQNNRVIILTDIEADPDGDSYSFLWFTYSEAGTHKNPIRIEGAENSHGAYIIAPAVDRVETAHFVLRVTDKGEPQLTSYKRVIVTIKP